MELTINGQWIGQLAFNGGVSTSDSNLYIGADPTEGSGLYLPCKVDEVRIWNRARSYAQIISQMHDTLDAVYYQSADSGLVAYYRFEQLEDLGINDDGADDIRDLSVYANHGDTQGNPSLVISDAMTAVEKERNSSISGFRLMQNYPNPFNPVTVIGYQLSAVSDVQLQIYNILGQKVATLVSGRQGAGTYQVRWDGSDLNSGIYVYRLTTDNGFSAAKRLVLMK
jgi:hypothetical protein